MYKKIDKKCTHFIMNSKMEEMKCFIFYPTLDEMLQGINYRF